MTRKAAGYIRRSSADAASPGLFSREDQEAAVRRMAAADGQPEPTLYVDWGVSGGKNDRAEYVRLKRAITEGKVSRVYALNMSRIGRSLRELLDFVDLCAAHDTTLRLDRDHLDTSTPSGRLAFHVLASVGQFVRELAAESQAASLAHRRARGDVLGQAHYGHKLAMLDGRYVEVPDPDQPVQPIRDALEEAGSVAAAVRLLNERGFAPPRGGERWHLPAFRRVVEHEWPGLLTTVKRSRPNGHRPSILATLLRCHCGATMTPNPAKGQYYCHRSRIEKSHGKAAISEVMIMPWVKAEAGRFRVPGLVDMGSTDATSERAALEAQRERLRTQHRLGVITDDELAASWDDVRAALDDLDTREGANVVEIPASIDWERDAPDLINGVLRALWDRVQLDERLHPTSATWKVPAWRAE